MEAEKRLPQIYVWAVIVLCALPTLASLTGFDFGSPAIDPAAFQMAEASNLVDQLHVSLTGSFVHTILEWSAFLAALFTVLLAFTHYSIERDAATLIIATALVCAGAMDAFHVLAADRLIAAVTDNRQFIPFTWAISRVFNVSVTILGTLVLLLRQSPAGREGRRESEVLPRPAISGVALWATCAGFGILAYVVIYLCASSGRLPQTLFPGAIISRPYDFVPLVLYLAAGFLLYPAFYRRYPSLFAHALILSVVPDAVTQLHMAFGSEALYDHHFNVAHGLKVVAYAVPLLGLMLDYSRTYRQAERARDDLEKAHADLEVRVRERTTELGAAKEAAVAANRAKSDFLAHMSHELRTPLNSILGYAQILRRDPALGERQQTGVETIEHSGDHLLSLINDILDLSKIEAGKLELELGDFSLPLLLESLADSERVRAEQEGLTFTYQAGTSLPEWVRGDQRKLRQILLNLVGNAIKFTERGGVTLRVEPDGDLAAAGREPVLRFTVKDTGPGIAADRLEEIFLPFHQASEHTAVEGTGLGLAISRRLVRLMGGELEVDSTPGEGSTFSVLLCLPELKGSAEGGPTLTADAREAVIGYRGERRKVLVVDDKSANRAVLAGLLGPIGFEISEAENGHQALERAVAIRPDLILMDLVMPVMDGFEATRRLRRNSKLERVVVIALSASVFDHNRHQSRSAGCDDFLPKPVRLEALLDRIAFHLNLQWEVAPKAHAPLASKSTGPIGDHQAESSAPITAGGEPTESDATNSASLPREALSMLLELARRGDVQAISRRLDEIESTHGTAGVTDLRRLATQYDMKAIRRILVARLEEEG